MVDLLIPGPEGKIETKIANHNNNDKSPIVLNFTPRSFTGRNNEYKNYI